MGLKSKPEFFHEEVELQGHTGRTEGDVGRGCHEVFVSMPGTDDSH